jgi:ATP-binding cassette subfamily B protein
MVNDNSPLGDYAHVFTPRRERLRKLPRLLRKALALVWSAGHRELIVVTLIQLLQGVGITAQLLIGKAALDLTLEEGSGPAADFSEAVPLFVLLVAISVLLTVAGSVQVELARVQGELVARVASERVLDVAAAVELAAYEDPRFFDRLRRAQTAALTRPLELVQALSTFVSSAVSVLGICVAVFVLQPLLVPFMLLAFAPLWYASTRDSKALFEFALRMSEDDRQRAYLEDVLSGRDEAKEIRAFDLGPLLRRRYARLYDQRIAGAREVARRRMKRSFIAAAGTSGLIVACLGILGYLYSADRMSLASVGVTVAALFQLSARLRGVANGAGLLYESALFVDDYYSFLALRAPMEHRSPHPEPLPAFQRLQAEHLTFTYPGTTEPAVRDVSIDIRAGEIVALVGENGSGKTTVAKLLAQLYAPSAGTILWDDVDTATCEPAAIRASVAVIFQDFVRYLLPVKDNIGAGRRERIDDRDAIVAAARSAGADSFIAELPHGYDTTLGKEFKGGYDLSIGQWQRLALARAFFRDAPFIILDEPTAALDPRAEHDLFDSIRDLFRGRTVLLISHRFSTVRTADRIYVLDRGRLVEHGSHDALMSQSGMYARLFTLQAAAYQPAAVKANGQGT